MNTFDPSILEQWALGYLHRLANGGRRGVLLGGSIARGQQWAHSDLEAGLLVHAHDSSIPYFNVDSDRGVEIIQLVSADLERDLDQVEDGILDAVAAWPIQMYKARVINDPTGLLARFTTQFDRHLFSPQVVRRKIEQHANAALDIIERVKELIAKGRPRAALSDLRNAMNEAVLMLYWSLGELPRSQNRVDSRLRDLTSRHNRTDFYDLYRNVFELDSTEAVIERDWPNVKEQIRELTTIWNAREFFDKAVDGTFSWGENGGILSVYRLYVPMLGRPDDGIFELLDNQGWSAENAGLLRFLGLASPDASTVTSLMSQVENTVKGMCDFA